MGEWSSLKKPFSIEYRELFPVVVASHLWGHHWVAKCVECCSDNMAVVSVLHSGTLKDPHKMVLLRSLSLSAARHSFAFTGSHRAGRDSCIADALPRFDFQHFYHLAPPAALAATPIRPSLPAQLPVI